MIQKRVAVVTGVTGDIGIAVANALIKDGFYVIGVARNESKPYYLDSIQDRSSFHFYKLDVANIEEVQYFFASTLILNCNIECLVTCAGILEMKNIYDTDEVSWNKIIDINLNGTFYFFRLSIQKIRKDGNKANLFAIGSRWGQDGHRNSIAYNTSKSALKAFVKSAQLDLLGSSIRAFLISPGSVAGSMSNSVDNSLTTKLIEPTQIADLIRFVNKSDTNIIFDEITIKANPYDLEPRSSI
ncbi:SDR family oxidoreductase [Fibrisoma limi]|uniref:SDR family oxidoreductase n=1 Tax=Fibrisoma limi TaxID=663275 RepID=UPI000586AB56|nr:SDR family oxidoreductase [Fibrisoma limi]